MIEIGSEFLNPDIKQGESKDTIDFLSPFGHYILTNSGRSSLFALIEQVKNVKCQSVLLPAYICDSVVRPFEKKGYNVSFYEVNERFEPVIPYEIEETGIVLLMSYFGFDQSKSHETLYNHEKLTNSIFVMDVTHSLFSEINYPSRIDFFIGSLRKWTGLNSGGFISSKKYVLYPYAPTISQFSVIRAQAFELKRQYFNNPQEYIKQEYLRLFKEAEDILDTIDECVGIDSLSRRDISSLDIDFIVLKRKANFEILANEVQPAEFYQPIYQKLPLKVVPFFFVLKVKNGYKELQNYLASKGIYAPHHWAKPEAVQMLETSKSNKLYDQLLSIPCDQRYSETDMHYIANMLKNYIE